MRVKKSKLLITVALSMFTSCAYAATPNQTLDLGMVPQGCKAVIKTTGWGIVCPNTVDEKRAHIARHKPYPILPGYPSNNVGFHNEETESNIDDGSGTPVVDYPILCREARIKFSDDTSHFIAFLHRENNSNNWNSLTREASYNVEQIIRQYHSQIDRDAISKFRYGERGTNDGDKACANHFNFGDAELHRIAQLIIDELNKGNRDLTNTGLNMYENKYNK